MRNSILRVLLLAGFVTIPAASHAATLDVPGAYATIQAAINAAANGDTVLVADGIYSGTGNYQLDTLGKAITVKSQNGPGNCILDIQQNGTGFYIHTNEGLSTVIQGFTIENGSGYSDISTIDDGEVTTGADDGGGVYVADASPTIANCTITKSQVSGDGYYIDAEGGGIYLYNSSAMITGCLITNNSTNSACNGGGISAFESNPTITNCTITQNTAGQGGGFYLDFDGGTITNCIIGQNTAIEGGGLYVESATTAITNCTVTQNSSPNGSGLWIGYRLPVFTNCILYADTGSSEIQSAADTAPPVITYSDVQGGYTGTGNIDADPLFLNTPIDLHLTAGSPCLGAGTTTGVPATDLDGITRPTPPSIGAYEGPDSLAPTTIASLAGTAGDNGWYVSTVTITLSASAPGGPSDITATYYTIDSGTAKKYTLPFRVSANGHHTVSYWSVSSSGRIEPHHLLPVNVDKVPPVTTKTLQGIQIGDAWVGGVTGLLGGTDSNSGPADSYYAPSSTNIIQYTGAFFFGKAGTHTWSYWSVDVAGNKERPIKVTAIVVQPGVTGLSKTSAKAGSASFTLTITGDYFLNIPERQEDIYVNTPPTLIWNGTVIKTKYISANQLTAIVPAKLLTTPGTFKLLIINPVDYVGKPYGESNEVTFTVN